METLQRTANRGSISTGYDIDNSVKLEYANSEGFSFTNGSTGNGQTWTVSYWFKRTSVGEVFDIGFGASGGLEVGFFPAGEFYFYNSGYLWKSNALYRDTSAWYHVVVSIDTTQGTAANRIRVYINGEEVTSLATDAPPSQNTVLKWNVTGNTYYIGYWPFANYYSKGYYADFHSVDGQQLAPTAFGEFDEDSGIWKPKAYAGSYGTNGFKLEFKDSADLAADTSGNSKTISANNITSADQATDTPTNNFCTINTIEYTGGYNITNGGTQAERNANTAWYSTTSSMGVSKGKWYWEAQFASGATSFMAGVSIDSYISTQANPFDGQYLGSGSGDGGFGYNNSGTVFYNNTSTSGYGSAPSTNIIGLAIDMDNEKAYVSINGTWQNSGDPTSGATGTGAIDLFLDSNGDTAFFSLCAYNPNYTHKINFGGYTTMSISSAASDENGYGNFEYAPPSGYYALCTKNLAEYG
jgi:hypothetical protein